MKQILVFEPGGPEKMVLSDAATRDLDTKYRARRHTDHWERGLPVD